MSQVHVKNCSKSEIKNYARPNKNNDSTKGPELKFQVDIVHFSKKAIYLRSILKN